MNAADRTIRQWQKAYSRRHWYWAILSLLTFSEAGVLFLAVMIGKPKPAFLALIGVSLLLIVVHRYGIDLAFWYSHHFRQAAWRVPRTFGKLRLWLSRFWPLFMLTALALLQQYVSLPEESVTLTTILKGVHPRTLFATTRWIEVVAGTLLAIAVIRIYRTRHQIVFEEFKNFTGNDTKNIHQGLSIRLFQKLSAISNLYSTIDDARPTPANARDDAVAVGMSISPTGDDLKNAVASDVKVSLGPIAIPVGAILAVFSRLIQGPLLGGSIHEENGRLFLVAHLSGGGRKGCWRAELGSHPKSQDFSDCLEKLIDQLAYRISTDLLPVGSPRWEAVYHYTEGLRAYRQSRVAGPEQQSLYIMTEKAFIRALEADREFAPCHYNLGILYRQMNNRKASAQAALRVAVEKAPQNYDAYYALALNYQQLKRWDDALWFCEQAIRLRPTCAAPWNLKGYVLRKAREERLGKPLKAGDDPEGWKETIPLRETAAALALREYSISALRGTPNPQAVETAVICTRNAAVAQAMTGEFGICARLFRQAMQLSDTYDNSDLYFEFGKTLLASKEFKRAAEAFDHVYENNLRPENRPNFWAHIAFAQFRLSSLKSEKKEERQYRAEAALNRFYDLVAGLIIPQRNDRLSKAMEVFDELVENLADIDDAQRIACELKHRKRFLVWLDEANQDDLEKKLSSVAVRVSPSPQFHWEIALTKLKLGYMLRSSSKPPDEDGSEKPHYLAITYFKEAIDTLTPKHTPLIVSHGWYSHLAIAILHNNQPKEALESAERAVRHDPEADWEWSILGSVYHALGDYERAIDAWEIGLSFSPTDIHSIQNIAKAYWRKGVATTNADNRHRAYTHVIARFRQALTLLDLDGIGKPDEAALIHFWIGRFQQELLRSDESISNLTISKELGFAPIQSCVSLGWVYLEANDYAEADKWFDNTCEEIWRRRPTDRSARRKWLSEPPTKPGTTETEPGEDDPIGTWLIDASLGLAYSVVLRNETAPNGTLDKALWLAFCSERLCLQSLGREYHPAIMAACHTVRGLAAYRKGSLVNACRHLDEAISIHPDPRSYRYLAEIYLILAKTEDRRQGFHPDWQRLTQEALRRAREADWRGLFTADLDRLSAELSAVPRPAVLLK